jgi:predicted phosphodiesterase
LKQLPVSGEWFVKKTRIGKLLMWGMITGAVLFSAARCEAFRFVVTGDTRGSDNGVNAVILAEMAQATIDEAADFIVVTGDLVNGSTDPMILQSQLTAWRNVMQPLYDANIGVYVCRGNHDTGSKASWDAVFSGSYAMPDNGPAGEENITYSFAHENGSFVVLDQYGAHLNRVNQAWLDTELASNALPHVFVFGHVPAFSVYHLDCLDDYPDARNRFWQSIASGCGRIYFTGHDHFYNHARIDDGDGNADNDLHQIITGAGGAPMYDWNGIYSGDNGAWTPQLVFHEKAYSYILAEVTGVTVTLTMKHRTGPGVYEEGGESLSFSYADTDADSRGDTCDNCPAVANAAQEDVDADRVGDVCDNCPADPNHTQADTLPPGGNDIGDACDCEGDFDGDADCDGSDVAVFKADFGRSQINTPCQSGNPCNGDFSCDGDVDGTDAVLIKADFGRGQFNRACPSHTAGIWCAY